MRNRTLLRVFAIGITAVMCTLVILSANLGQYASAQPVSTNGMAYAQVNKSGCTVHKGNCQIRLDFYLEPEDPRYYDKYLYLVDTTSSEYLAGYPGKVDKEGNPEDQADYDLWLESLPHIWQNTPFHSHFIYLPASFTQDDIKAQIDIHLKNFYQAFQDRWDEVKGGMKHGWATETRIRPTNYSKTDTAVEYDARVAECQVAIDALTELQYKPKKVEGGSDLFPATEIDVGTVPSDGVASFTPGYTVIDGTNPANDAGSIDTFELWAATSLSNCKVGTFYGTPNNFTDRDYETIGSVTAGSKQTFTGLDCDIQTGDLAGAYYSGGTMERHGSGATMYYDAGDQFGTGQTYFTPSTAPIFLYGTGETAGCSPSYLISPGSWSVNGGSPVSESSSYSTGLGYFNVTNDSSGGAIDISISAGNMTGGGYTWVLSDTATPGDMIYGMKAGLSGGSYNIIVKQTIPYNTLVSSLADDASQLFGLQLYTPTNFDDGNSKSGGVTLTVVCS